MLYNEDFSMCHYVGFLQIRSIMKMTAAAFVLCNMYCFVRTWTDGTNELYKILVLKDGGTE